MQDANDNPVRPIAESPLVRSLTPYFRMLADQALQAVRNQETWISPVSFGAISLETMNGPIGPDKPTVLVIYISQSHGQKEFLHISGSCEDPLVEVLSSWAEAAPKQAAGFIKDVLYDALTAGATVDDLVFTIANAVASTVIET